MSTVGTADGEAELCDCNPFAPWEKRCSREEWEVAASAAEPRRGGPGCLAVGLNQGFSNLLADEAENHL